MPFIDTIADRIIGHTVNLMRFDASLRQEVRGILEDLRDDLVLKTTTSDPTQGKNQTMKMQRARQLLADVDDSIDTAYKKADTVSAKGLFGVAQLESRVTRNAVNGLVGADLMSVTLDPQTLKTLTNQSLVLGAPASEWWGRQKDGLKRAYADQIRIGILAGDDLSTMLQRVRGKHTGKYIQVTDDKGKSKRVPEFAGGAMGASTREAEALIRTSVQSVANDARMASYLANQDVIKGVQALVTLDNRTTPLCRGRSGFAWTLPDGEPIADSRANIKFPGPPPWHYQCRSTLVPVLRSWAELAGPKSKLSKEKLDELESKIAPRMQSSMDGQVAGDLKYEDWISTKPEAFQKEVLGPGRFKLWKEGKINFVDMIDQTGNPITLEQLESMVDAGNTLALKPPPVAPDPSAGWKPSMTQKEADEWRRNSAVEGDVIHYTSAEAASSIAKEGFNLDLSDSGAGDVFGKGVYVIPDDASAATKSFYKREIGGTPMRLAVNVSKVHTVELDSIQFGKAVSRGKSVAEFAHLPVDQVKVSILHGIKDAPKLLEEALKANTIKGFGGMVIPDVDAAIHQVLQDAGFDAVKVINRTFNEGIGGDQLLVLNPKSVTVIKRGK